MLYETVKFSILDFIWCNKRNESKENLTFTTQIFYMFSYLSVFSCLAFSYFGNCEVELKNRKLPSMFTFPPLKQTNTHTCNWKCTFCMMLPFCRFCTGEQNETGHFMQKACCPKVYVINGCVQNVTAKNKRKVY